MVGVAASAVTVAKTASEVLLVEGVNVVEALRAAAVAIRLGVTVGTAFGLDVAPTVAVSTGEVFDCNGEITRLPHAAVVSIMPAKIMVRDQARSEKNDINLLPH